MAKIPSSSLLLPMLFLENGRYLVLCGFCLFFNATLVNLLIPSMLIPILGDTQDLPGPGQPAWSDSAWGGRLNKMISRVHSQCQSLCDDVTPKPEANSSIIEDWPDILATGRYANSSAVTTRMQKQKHRSSCKLPWGWCAPSSILMVQT